MFKLDEESSWLCVIVTPFGKFGLARLPVGFLDSPSWARGTMEESFEDLPCVEGCINDAGIFSHDFETHCKTADKVLSILQLHNFCVEPAKCHWMQKSAPWLGHIASSDGIRPNHQKLKHSAAGPPKNCNRTLIIHWHGQLS